jgi:hypothetical protein
MENMKTGVKSGMVRNIEACKGGLQAFKSYFYWHAAVNNGTGENKLYNVISQIYSPN